MDNDVRFGHWKESDLETAVKQYNGSQYYSGYPSAAHFVHSVAKILAIRNAIDRVALCSASSLYILGTVPECASVTLKREPAFSLGGVDVSGKIWFGAEAMNSSNGVPIPAGADTDTLFTYVSQTLTSGKQPTIYFDGAVNGTAFRFYPDGVDAPDRCEDISFSGAHLDETTLKNVLDKIHNCSLITPSASMASKGLWCDGAKCYPVKEAEKAIQSIIEVGLAPALGNVRVKREETGTYGRYDLALIEQDPLDSSKSTNHAILELKVIRTFSSTGGNVSENTNKTAILKGIKQAYAYHIEHGSRISALCCYDMRPTPDLHKKSGRKCVVKSLEIHFWAWPLFSTTEAARNWLTSDNMPGIL